MEMTYTIVETKHRWAVLDIVPAPTFVDAVIRSAEYAHLRDTAGIEPPSLSDVVERRVEIDGDGTALGRMEWETSATYENGWPHQWRERDALVHRYDLSCERNESDQKVVR